ncbi:hypothetical protein SLUN_05045 [Streptomyces lunaelactis]|uniref:Uncharacterized protein n=1 Tax=Streptomyces lunaelactis TaxID=1535768 RepID=A0A2R4SXQ3_9ACTN|nr:DUF6332 family protein [Streptomyces lunaelactis]AVZ71653.1 hypothetical protein SLUN_05045 [Streptomyces lunaelactis]NUK83370.1 hypothetical protein [Streptomyces lunaelactis]NUL03235.1 hypothetical protein [Streptomyces lunaelactis]
MGRRTQAERDAITVETGYALASGFLVGGLTFLGVAGPTMVFPMPPAAERGLVVGGAVAGAVVFVLRVVTVLWRFPRTPPQPSQPGRTSPDS